MTPTLSDLQTQLAARGERGPGHRYPVALQEAITAYVVAARQQGVLWRTLSDQLQISPPTLARWHSQTTETVPDDLPLLCPVHLSEPSPRTPLYSLEAPNGLKLHGLDLNTALQLWRQFA